MQQTQPSIIHRYLSNGMEVYLHPTDFAPVISLQVVVKAGSIDEEPHEYGVAHVLEHMLFKGTEKYPNAGQIASCVEFAGGDINAYTTFDHTNYHLSAPAAFVQEGSSLLLDVVSQSLLDENELSKELEVVLEEIRRGQDNPGSVVSHRLFSLFFQGTPLERPVIGFSEGVAAFSRETVHHFYKKWYVPNNMIFIAAGDFAPQELLEHLEKLSVFFAPKSVPQRLRPFSKDPHSNSLIPKLIISQEPKHAADAGPWQEARVQLALKAPALEEDNMVAWDVFSSVLGENDSSRLVRVLRDETQIVTSIDCSCYTPKYPWGLFGIGFYAKAQNALPAIKSVVQEIRRLAEVPPTQEELSRVLASLKAQRIYGQESMDGIARNVGLSLQTSLKMDFEPHYMASISTLKPIDVQLIAKEVLCDLQKGSFSVAAAISQEALNLFSSADLAKAIQEESRVLPLLKKEPVTWSPVDSSLKSSPDDWLTHYETLTSLEHPEVRQIRIPLPHGKTLHINHRASRRLPITCGMLVVRNGLLAESEGKNGSAGLCASFLTRGTVHQSYRKFIEELEDHASSLSAFSGRDLFGLRFDAMAENSLRTIQMLLDCFFKPEFADSEWQRLQNESLEIIKAQKDNPIAQLSRLCQPLLYPSHPYALTSLGTKESVSSLEKNDVVNHWKNIFRAKEFIFSIAGDFDLRSIVNFLETEFKTHLESLDPFICSEPWEQQLPAPKPTLQDCRVAYEVMDREQTHILLSCRAFSLQERDRTVLEIAANILAGQGGRLFLDLRDKQSLAYTVSASQTPNLCGGVFNTYIATAAHKVSTALAGLKSHIERLACECPTPEELLRAKNSLLGSQSIESQHHSFLASQLATSDVYQLGFDYFLKFRERVASITVEDIPRVMHSLLSNNPPILAAVGRENKEFCNNPIDLQWILK